jgi:hypothetical protein
MKLKNFIIMDIGKMGSGLKKFSVNKNEVTGE